MLHETSQLETQQVKMSQLPPFLPSKRWSEKKASELEIRRSTDAVTDGQNIYVRRSNAKEILVYNIENDSWANTPLTGKYFRSSIVIVNKKLITVGGLLNRANDTVCTSELINITDGNIIWKTMNEPRSRCTSITFTIDNNTYLIIAGGEHPEGNTLTSVEILTKSDDYRAKLVCPLPEKRYSCSAAIVKDNLYLLGGWKERQKATRKVLKCSIHDLVESSNVSSPGPWETLDAELPVAQSTCVSFNNKLLTFGGTWCECYECKCNRPSREIYMYEDDSDKFECIGSTPNAQYLCVACVFQGGKIFIAGGAENKDDALKDVYIYDDN